MNLNCWFDSAIGTIFSSTDTVCTLQFLTSTALGITSGLLTALVLKTLCFGRAVNEKDIMKQFMGTRRGHKTGVGRTLSQKVYQGDA
ncbi:hypothetical protein L484_001156 [Morus notabilis]|uniref:Uncharacterized protein n=1 Tax=Morus notabilis TaxID=981085 RepID=W9R1S7_9ROSA|nr:hypothetical protein L484_001156 [Morus notabilis]